MENCIFCKISKGEIPCHKVYEDENFIAFLDIAPKNVGHTLVIPKQHYRWVWDVPKIGEYYEVVKKVANGIRSALQTEFIVSLVIGEEVPHAHVWLVPRFENDGHGEAIDFSVTKQMTTDEMALTAKKISQEIN